MDEAAVRQRALALLSRREHGEKELTRKLTSRGFDTDAVVCVIEKLKQEGLQSDFRYADVYVNSRSNRGYGPARITRELQDKGISTVLIDEIMEEYRDTWQQQAEQVRIKKFGSSLPVDFKEQSKQSRFLQYRGFQADQIRKCFRTTDE